MTTRLRYVLEGIGLRCCLTGPQLADQKKRRRFAPKERLPQEKVDVLEAHYAQDQYPSLETCEGLARQLDISVEKACNWFSNRRKKQMCGLDSLLSLYSRLTLPATRLDERAMGKEPTLKPPPKKTKKDKSKEKQPE